MASLSDNSQTSPPNPSFAIRDTTDHRLTFLLRSLSSKDPSDYHNNIDDDNEDFPYHPSPPRLSVQHDRNSHHRAPSPPLKLHSSTACRGGTETTSSSYRCVASTAVKKDGQVLSMAAATSDVELLYTGTDANVIRVWKLAPELTECGQLKTRAGRVVAIHVAGDRVYGAYGDGKIRVWQRTWRDSGGGFKHVRVGTIPATGGVVRSYISAAGKDNKTSRHKGPITSLAINIADDILYSSSLDKTVKVWRISDLKCVETIPAHSSSINSILVSGADALLFTASDDATIRVWRRNFCGSTGGRPHALVVTLPAKQSPVKALALTPDGSVLYGGCSDGYVHFWTKGWQLQYGGALQGHTHAVMVLAAARDGGYVVSGSADRTCRVWRRDVVDGGGVGSRHVCLAVLVGHHGPVRSLVVLAATRSMWRVGGGGDREVVNDGGGGDDRGCVVCSGSLDGVLKVWSVTRDSGDGKGILHGGGGGGWLPGNGREYFELQK
ncbi:unnamed protein product [Linum trigynum]|uniref:Uncharacterized protein n=1 Tax=Linum trigynum TaxID=586398 RepID=A0AAV2DXR9_9ROSI